MNDIAISIDHLSKLYRIGANERPTTFRESITNAASAPLRRIRERRAPTDGGENTFWALKDISFDVRQGEVVGIVGRNGAGKSTLLKVLSRITGLTEGRAQINGRVGSLLEVGTGFHPELTGRENIFMNGAILGMSRNEIRSKFDEIVEFSEVGKFIDTPVKRYSSGMYTRLAFSVAAHLEPEIMIVDEVLAVGDMAFQQKCLGKMNQVAGAGRTVLFVSHNMAAVESLCSRVVLLNAGTVEFDGSTLEGIRRYYDVGREGDKEGLYLADTNALAKTETHIRKAQVITTEREDGVSIEGSFAIGAPLIFEVECYAPTQGTRPTLGIAMENARGIRVTSFHTKCAPELTTRSVQGTFVLRCEVDDLALAPGRYAVSLGLDHNGTQLQNIQHAFAFTILPTDFFNNSGKRVGGVVYSRQKWSLQGGAR
ncbi:ABC transporter ATP-binding protein [bacterium]|nr:MAG: ABC transporter ATP-binding protein [bacterium]